MSTPFLTRKEEEEWNNQKTYIRTTNDIQTAETVKSTWDIIKNELWLAPRFADPEVEKLFEKFILQTNVSHMIHLLLLLIFLSIVMCGGFTMFSIAVGKGGELQINVGNVITISTALTSTGLYIVALCIIKIRCLREHCLHTVSYIIVLTFILNEIMISRIMPHTWVTMFYVYVIYTLLPIRLLKAIVTSLVVAFVHIPLTKKNWSEAATHMLIMLCINTVGVMTLYTEELAKLAAFNRIRHTIRLALHIKKIAEKQENFMLMLLPDQFVFANKEVISNMPIHFIEKYEPVSILFADICEFNTLLSKLPAKQLINLLNQLYIGFEKTTQRNSCLAIKLLGDCYYCVSGLPKATSNHAVHCVTVGFDMIENMRMVGVEFNVDIDLRVGIHTGCVHSYVLGVRKWQFDIWSNDVILAKHMESGGMPGRIHITKETGDCLPHRYRLENGNGADREIYLRNNNIETYFVIPSANVIQDALKGRGVTFESDSRGLAELIGSYDSLSPIGKSRKSIFEGEVTKIMNETINPRGINQIRSNYCYWFLLIFRNLQVESMYRRQRDHMLFSYFLDALFIYIVVGIIQLIILPSTFTFFISFLPGLLYIVTIVYIVSAGKCSLSPSCMKMLSLKIHHNRHLAQFLAASIIMVSFAATAIPIVLSDAWRCKYKHTLFKNYSRNASSKDDILYVPIARDTRKPCSVSQSISYPDYLIIHTLLVMIMTCAFQIIFTPVKVFILASLFFAYTFLFLTAPYFNRQETAFKLYVMTIILTGFLFLIFIHSKQIEIIYRLDFIWKLEMETQKDYVFTIEKLNKKLIANIFPVHVANHFMRRDKQYQQLYFNEHELVAIMFATIVNFAEYYNETEQIDKGTGAINILHEIISSFDILLKDSKYQCIEKIKSAGVTYMTVSGLAMTENDANKMSHVEAMANYVLDINSKIGAINDKHKTTFQLRVGMNVGPVVAGVIGVRKPQYDVWGNAVNIASKMESTGLPGKIQVTQDLHKILFIMNFSLTSRGVINIKGTGNMTTYFLNGPQVPWKETFLQWTQRKISFSY